MGRSVLVTGGSRGIGAAVAARLAADGHRVAATYHTSEPPEGLLAVRCDVTDSAAVDEAFVEVEQRQGPVEVLVACAGVTRDKLAMRMSDEDFRSVLDTNLMGAFWAARRAITKMVTARWGRVILVSSVVGLRGEAGQANYAASKAGLVGLGRSLAREVGSRNITVNIVTPGLTRTDMTAAMPASRLEEMVREVPLRRLAEPQEVAALVAFLASDDAAYVTGAVIPVDGGAGMGH